MGNKKFGVGKDLCSFFVHQVKLLEFHIGLSVLFLIIMSLNFKPFFTTFNNTSTNKSQGDLVGWMINTEHFRLGKTIEISSQDKKTYPTHAVSGIIYKGKLDLVFIGGHALKNKRHKGTNTF